MPDHDAEILGGPSDVPSANDGQSFAASVIAVFSSMPKDKKASIFKSLSEAAGEPAPETGTASKAAPEKTVTSAAKPGLLASIKDNVIPAAIATLLGALLLSQITSIKADISGLRTELKGEITQLRTELKADISDLRTELKGETAELRNDLKALTEIVTRMRIDMARFLPATSSQSASDQDGERPRPSDNPGGGGGPPAQSAPAASEGTAPPSR